MTDVEYTEQVIGHLENLDTQVADRVMNKVDEATDIDSGMKPCAELLPCIL